jgi:hypothetical protein
LLVVMPRLGPAARRSCVEAVLAGGSAMLALLTAADEIEPGTFAQDELMRSPLYQEFRAAIAGRDGADRRTVDLSALGFLATASAAEAIVRDLTTAGLTFADPSLALLRLNAALDTTSSETET